MVVDLETTGTKASDSGITEIGAVKVRGGEILGEFQSLVNPGCEVPAFIARLTGITSAMVATAPRIDLVLPSFLEWAQGCVLVAHNAGFDVGFLKAACAGLNYPWPSFPVVDTVALSRRVVTKDEVPNHKLGTLARFFRAEVTPDHRALADARATVDVLHGLFDRLGRLGVTHFEDLATATDPVPPAIRKKSILADNVPESPGVYLFTGPGGEVLYIGTSTNLRKRVRSYFTAAEKRKRIKEMLGMVEGVTPIVCASPLEAAVRELRLIAEHQPHFNRRSKYPGKHAWVRLNGDKLQVVKAVRDDAAHMGPFPSVQMAREAVRAVTSASGSLTDGPLDRELLLGDPSPVTQVLAKRIARLASEERFEEAGALTSRLSTYVNGAGRAQRLAPVAGCAEMVAGRPTTMGGWELVSVKHGRFAGTVVTQPGDDVLAAIDTLRLTSESVEGAIPPAPACLPEEAALVLAWLESPGVRLAHTSHPWVLPARSAVAQADLAEVSGVVSAHLAALEAPLNAPLEVPLAA